MQRGHVEPWKKHEVSRMGTGLHILMLSPTLPWPLNTRKQDPHLPLLRELARAVHEVTLLTMFHEPCGPEDLEALRAHC